MYDSTVSCLCLGRAGRRKLILFHNVFSLLLIVLGLRRFSGEEECQQQGAGGDRGRGHPGQEAEGAARSADRRIRRRGQNMGPLLSLSGARLDTGE